MIELRISPETSSDSALAWATWFSNAINGMGLPLVILIIAFIFRSSIRNLIENLSEVSGLGFSAKVFERKLKQAQEVMDRVEKAEPPIPGPPDNGGAVPIEPDAFDVNDPFLQLAQTYPAAAVLEAYKEVETYLKSYAIFVRGTGTGSRVSVGGKELQKVEVDPDTYSLFRQLKDTRNAAVHSTRGITPGEALEYRELCRRFIHQLKRVINRTNAAPI